MTSFPRILLAGVCALTVSTLTMSTAAIAAPHATSHEAQAMLDKAVAELAKVGPEKAFVEFNRGEAGFKDKDLYVFVFDLKGKYEASGGNPKLVGADAIDMTDAEGKPVVHAMIAAVKDAPQGRVDYIWLNRADNRVEHKRSLVRRVGDHIVGVGYYTG